MQTEDRFMNGYTTAPDETFKNSTTLQKRPHCPWGGAPRANIMVYAD